MANTLVTLSAGDVVRKALSILHNNLVFTKTVNKQYDDRFARSGAKNGGSLLIRNPNQFQVRTGSVMDTQDLEENTQTLTVATQLGVDINFSSVELTLSLDDFAERILKPACNRLAAEVDKTVINGCYPYVYNFVPGTLGTAPGLADILASRAKLAKGLAPATDRYFVSDSLGMNSIITSAAAYFHSGDEISREFDTGKIGNMYGYKFYETEMTPTHTCGSRTDTTPTVSTTSLINMTTKTYMSMTANATGTTINPGDIFTIGGVYAVNPETKAQYAHLQQFSVTATAAVSTSSCLLQIVPAVYTSGARQNVNIATAAAGATATFLSFGSASVGYINSLAYHRDAFTFVTADLEMPRGVDFSAREVYDGISMRIVRQYDVVNDKFPCRLDILFGYKAIRPEWACRVCS